MRADRALAELLTRMGLLKAAEVERQARGGLAAYCARLGMSEAELLASIARELDLELEPSPRVEVEHTVSVSTMRRRGFLPLREEGGALLVAVCRPWDPTLEETLAAAFPNADRIERRVTPEAALAAALKPGLGRSSSGVTTSELGSPTEELEGERAVATQVVRTRRDQARTMLAPAVQGGPESTAEQTTQTEPSAPVVSWLATLRRRLESLPQWAWIAAVLVLAFFGLLFAIGGPSAPPVSSGGATRLVVQAGAPLRVFRRAQGRVLATLPIGREVELLQSDGVWALVLLSEDGPAGFVSADALGESLSIEAWAEALRFQDCEAERPADCAPKVARQRARCAASCPPNSRCPEACARAAERCAAACEP